MPHDSPRSKYRRALLEKFPQLNPALGWEIIDWIMSETPAPVDFSMTPGAMVHTMSSPSGNTCMAILLTWESARFLRKALTAPPGLACDVPIEKCLGCTLHKEMTERLTENGELQ